MKIHYLQHVEFEGLGSIEDWIKDHGYQYTCTRMYRDGALPEVTDMDFLIIMGGPMNVDETDRYPWLTKEKEFIKAVIDNNTPVLGICLGAQLIASALKVPVMKNPDKEIGWHPVTRAVELANHPLARIIPEQVEVFHWHGDTFELPESAVRIAGSSACTNQGFIYRERVIALQFHLESTAKGIKQLIDNCKNEIIDAPYIQTADQMLSDESRFRKINDLMFKILDYQASLSEQN